MIKIRSWSEFYTELYDSEQSVILHTDRKEVPEITPWELEAAIRDIKNVQATDNDHINIDTLTAGEDAILKSFAKLYTTCLSEGRKLLHQQLDGSPSTQRKQQDQHQGTSTTGRDHIAQAVYGSTRKHIPTTDLGNQWLDDRRQIS